MSSFFYFRQDIYTDDEFLNTLDRFNCRSRVHPRNMYSVILEIAKQELIQKPYIMVCSWGKYINSLKQYDHLKSPEAVQKLCRGSEPTNKNVLTLLKAREIDEGDSFKYLQQYTCGLEQVQLLKFPRFVTGANIISGGATILVNFIKIEGFQRRPVAHTCGPLPELLNSYRNYCELREEFQQVLSGNSWSFDTV